MSIFGTHSPRRVAMLSVVGLVLGFFSYVTMLTSSVVLLYPLLLCYLFIRGGWLPVLSSIVGFATFHTMSFGAIGAAFLSVMMVVPALVTLIAVQKGLPYFKQFKIAILTFAGSVVITLLALGGMTGGNLADVMVEALYEAAKALPETLQNDLLTMSFPEFAEETSASIPLLSNAVRAEYWEQFFSGMRDTLINQMLPTLLKSSLASGFLCSYLTARSLSLRGEIPQTAFVPLSQWHIPGQMTVGILLATLAAYLVDLSGYTGSVGTFLTMFAIMECVFAVQGVAAWDRMMCVAKATYRRKALTAGAVAVLAPTFLSAIGLCSALFGRQGLITQMKNKMNPPN